MASRNIQQAATVAGEEKYLISDPALKGNRKGVYQCNPNISSGTTLMIRDQ